MTGTKFGTDTPESRPGAVGRLGPVSKIMDQLQLVGYAEVIVTLKPGVAQAANADDRLLSYFVHPAAISSRELPTRPASYALPPGQVELSAEVAGPFFFPDLEAGPAARPARYEPPPEQDEPNAGVPAGSIFRNLNLGMSRSSWNFRRGPAETRLARGSAGRAT